MPTVVGHQEAPVSHPDLPSVLASTGAITDSQARELARGGVQNPGSVASRVLALGWADERAVCGALATVVGNPAIVLSESTLDLSALSLLPEVVAVENAMLPVRMDADILYVASTRLEPGPVHQRLSSVSGRKVVLLCAIDDVLMQAISAAYAAARGKSAALRGRMSSSEAPALAVVRPTARAANGELSSLIRSLTQSLTVLRAAARVEHAPGQTAAAPTDPAATTQVLPSPSALPRAKTLPVAVVPAPRSPTPPPAVHAAVPIVLVVDDDDGIRKLITQALRHDGRTVVEAADGNAAFAFLRSTKPALVVLDAMLPGIHGFEICASIKRSVAYRDVPVVMVSAVYRGWEQARDIQETHGADAFIEKPFSVHVLRGIIANVLGQAVRFEPLPPDRRAMVQATRAHVQALQTRGQWSDALERVGHWLAVDPFDPAGHVEQGNLLLQLGNYEAAMRAYETAVAFDRKIFAAQANLAMVYEHLGFRRKSDETWRLAASCAPDDNARRAILDRLEPRS